MGLDADETSLLLQQSMIHVKQRVGTPATADGIRSLLAALGLEPDIAKVMIEVVATVADTPSSPNAALVLWLWGAQCVLEVRKHEQAKL